GRRDRSFAVVIRHIDSIADRGIDLGNRGPVRSPVLEGKGGEESLARVGSRDALDETDVVRRVGVLNDRAVGFTCGAANGCLLVYRIGKAKPGRKSPSPVRNQGPAARAARTSPGKYQRTG